MLRRHTTTHTHTHTPSFSLSLSLSLPQEAMQKMKEAKALRAKVQHAKNEKKLLEMQRTALKERRLACATVLKVHIFISMCINTYIYVYVYM